MIGYNSLLHWLCQVRLSFVFHKICSPPLVIQLGMTPPFRQSWNCPISLLYNLLNLFKQYPWTKSGVGPSQFINWSALPIVVVDTMIIIQIMMMIMGRRGREDKPLLITVLLTLILLSHVAAVLGALNNTILVIS